MCMVSAKYHADNEIYIIYIICFCLWCRNCGGFFFLWPDYVILFNFKEDLREEVIVENLYRTEEETERQQEVNVIISYCDVEYTNRI